MKFLFFLVFYTCLFSSDAQKYPALFVLKGSVNIDTGQVFLMPVGENAYYPRISNFEESKIKNGNFLISDSIDYPSAFRIAIKVNSVLQYVSDYFYIDSGIQNIQCNIDSSHVTPIISNQSMVEFENVFSSDMDSLEQEKGFNYKRYDSLFKIYKKSIPADALLKYTDKQYELKEKQKEMLNQYIKQHPFSYIGLWELVKEVKNGYNRFLDSAYLNLSDSLTKTFTGIELKEKIALLQPVRIGERFPLLPLVDSNLKKATFSFNDKNVRYYFVDFWFSHCMPCIGQFPELKNIYSKYAEKGFVIFSVSVDKQSAIEEWKGAIKKYNLNWSQYLDVNGTQSAKLSILSFPTNFLLDGNGNILFRNCYQY
jgi:thiol-disulfide isomerase/thioredoxin